MQVRSCFKLIYRFIAYVSVPSSIAHRPFISFSKYGGSNNINVHELLINCLHYYRPTGCKKIHPGHGMSEIDTKKPFQTIQKDKCVDDTIVHS